MAFSRYAARLNPTQPIPPGDAPLTRVTLHREESVLHQDVLASSTLPYKIQPGSVRFSKLPLEPEDAHLTGGTRSLSRRLLGLNLIGSLVSPNQYRRTGKDGHAA